MEELAAAKELQRRSVLPFSADSGEGAQDSCRRAQAKPSPRVLAVLFFLAIISCCAEFIAIWTAATSFAGQSCSAQEDECLLRRRANQAMAGYSDLGASAATLPWEVHSSADRGRQGGGEENPRKHRVHVAPCFRGLREDRGSESPQGIRQGNHFPSPDEVAHRICPARVKPSFSCSSGAALATGLGFRGRGCSLLGPLLCHPPRGLPGLDANKRRDSLVQAPASFGPRDLGCRTAGHRDKGRTAGATGWHCKFG